MSFGGSPSVHVHLDAKLWFEKSANQDLDDSHYTNGIGERIARGLEIKCRKCSKILSRSPQDECNYVNGYWVSADSPNYKIGLSVRIMSGGLLVARLYCETCMAPLGYKVLAFVAPRTSQVPAVVPENQCSDINNYKNHLIDIENKINAKLAKIKYDNTIKNMGRLLGKNLLIYSEVQVTPT